MRRRFVILEHDHPMLHWDLMFETGDMLRTWRLEHPPQSGRCIAATALADHRREYLDYEGPVSGGRGSVKRWDAGTFDEFFESGTTLTVAVNGTRVRGTIFLHRTQFPQEWQFVLRRGPTVDS